ncbi:MAG: DUF4290 domain-containing protein [Saprospiraceae bacterium]|jgi:hypothetical protein|nr:DUF4290 domain-containing protein [Saprospiraceae bacterium]HRD80198.1 DUF4290 domain-containing protein [Saprospiraceae bacterium]HRF37765.1 DUF4290 domain-containing protein [Saprospiraceae bacterium]HRJ13390.1 DUF4290 domain-containing protein [Saprospiraceae bacterium]HRK82762.1 DUF4290 domain-containing protein [Saprospiraceae bacterium]
MRKMDIEYNTSRNELVMPEYGRHVQLMVEEAKRLTDNAHRQAFVEKIVDLMYIMNPQQREVEDYRDRLWKHVFRIAGYDLEGVMPPNGIIPTPENDIKRPDHIEYPGTQLRFRHYGHYIQELIKKAKQMEDGPIKEGLVASIGSYMKLAYKTWNKDHYVSDDVIKNDLVTLSGGILSMPDEMAIENLTPMGPPKKSSPQNQRGQQQQGGGKSNKKKKVWKRK